MFIVTCTTAAMNSGTLALSQSNAKRKQEKQAKRRRACAAQTKDESGESPIVVQTEQQ
jgi:hypothetical protein